ncbi:MAG: hypothetical protein Q4A66_00065 [Eubacteriales bacterium]|nr:hypothetical protein [Eubacteriales bacterium]
MQKFFDKPRLGRRLAALLLGVFLMGAGVAVFDQLGFGTDPCSVMNLAISRIIGWSYGNWLLTMNVILLAVLALLGELRRIGVGSLANIVLVGYSADLVSWLIDRIHPLAGETLAVRLIVFCPTMLVFLLAVALYMVVDMGVAPYDAIPQVISARIKKPFAVVRLLWDVLILSVGFLLGGTVGLVTLITGFCVGPVFGAIAKRMRPFFE